MALTFPRDLPAVGFTVGTLFTLERREARATTRGGDPQAIELASPLWNMRYRTIPLSEADAETVDAWLASLRGGAKKFKAWSPLRQWPLAYPTGFGGQTRQGGGSFDGTATITATAGTLDSVTINTLPSTFKITTGDLVSIGYASGARTLHKAMETVTASAGAASFAVEPVLLPGGPVGTAGAVTFAAPWCYATLDAGKPDVSWIHGRMAQISFNATQAYK